MPHRETEHTKLARIVIKTINDLGVAKVWKMPSGMFKKRGGGTIRGVGCRGVPDICGYTNLGKFLGIEIKILPHKLSAVQIEFKKHVERVGGFFFTFTNKDNLEDLIDAVKIC